MSQPGLGVHSKRFGSKCLLLFILNFRLFKRQKCTRNRKTDQSRRNSQVCQCDSEQLKQMQKLSEAIHLVKSNVNLLSIYYKQGRLRKWYCKEHKRVSGIEKIQLLRLRMIQLASYIPLDSLFSGGRILFRIKQKLIWARALCSRLFFQA